jgi:hypothetical protein
MRMRDPRLSRRPIIVATVCEDGIAPIVTLVRKHCHVGAAAACRIDFAFALCFTLEVGINIATVGYKRKAIHPSTAAA